VYQAITFASESLLFGLADERITPATKVTAARTPAIGVQTSRLGCCITPPQSSSHRWTFSETLRRCKQADGQRREKLEPNTWPASETIE
jgi:hypothetical protein